MLGYVEGFSLARKLFPALLAAALLAQALPAAASTTVPAGTISTDTTWNLAGSPYIVTGTVTVQGTDGGDGVTTLTIEPGVVVRFQGGRALNIGGTSVSSPGALVADGDGTGGPATILFTSDAGSPAKGDWGGIAFRAGARASSVMRNVVVEYCGNGGWGGVHMTHAAATTLVLSDVTIRHSGHYGIYQQTGATQMSQVTVSDTDDMGFHIYSGDADLSQMSISGSGSHGIQAAGSQFSLVNSSVASNVGHDLYIVNGVAGTVTNCSSIESVFYAGSSSQVTWTGNTFNNWGALTSRVGAEDLGHLIADNTINKVGGASLEVAVGTVRLDSDWTDAVGSPYVWYGDVIVDGADGGDGVTTLTIQPGLDQRMSGNRVLYVGGTNLSSPGALVADGTSGAILFTSDSGSPAKGNWGGINFRGGAHASSVMRNLTLEYCGSGGWGCAHMTHAAATTLVLSNVTIRHSGHYGIYQQTGATQMSQVTVSDTDDRGYYIYSGDADLSQMSISGSGSHGIQAAGSQFSLVNSSVASNVGHDLYIVNGVAGTVTNCSSIESVFYAGSSSQVTWTGNTFNNWGALTSRVGAEDLGHLIADNTINKVGGASLEVAVGTVRLDSDWTDAVGSPYVWYGDVIVDGADGGDGVTTLTIQPGLDQRMSGNRVLYVGGTNLSSPGALVADGTSGAILFTSDSGSPAKGNWGGINFRGGAHASSVMRNLTLEYCGSGGWGCAHMTHAAATTLVLSNVTIRHSGHYGIYQQTGATQMSQVTVSDTDDRGYYIYSGDADLSQMSISGSGSHGIQAAGSQFSLVNSSVASNVGHDLYIVNGVAGTVTNCSSIESVFYAGSSSQVTWTGNTFNNWGALTSRVGAEDLGHLIADNTINKVGGASLEVAVGTVRLDSDWTDAVGSPYVWYGDVIVDGADGGDGVTTLTIQPGLDQRMSGNRVLYVGGTNLSSPGALVADGTSGAILFTSDSGSPAKGNWGGINFRGGAHASSVMRNLTLEYCGSGGWGCAHMTHAAATTLVLSNVTIRHSGHYGIYQQTGATQMSQVTVSDTDDRGYYIYSGDADLSQMSISGSGSYGIQVAGSQFSLVNSSVASNVGHDIRIVNGVTGAVTDCSSIESVFYAGSSSQVTWTGNTFNNWGALTSRVGAEDLGHLIANNTINKAGGASVEVAVGTVRLDSDWTDAVGSPYVWYGDVIIEGTDGGDGVTTLTIQPGLDQRMVGNRVLYVGGTNVSSPGALVADGDGAGGPATILFTSDAGSPAEGDWGAINFRGGAHESSLIRNAVVEYAGSGGWASLHMVPAAATTISLDDVTVRHSGYRGIYLQNGAMALSNCSLESNDDYDIFIYSSTPSSVSDCASIESVYYNSTAAAVDWSGNTFNNWGARTSRVAAQDLGTFSSQNTFNGSPGAVLEVLGTTVSEDSLWTSAPGPFEVQSQSIVIQGADGPDGRATLTLDPGVTLKMPANTGIYVGGNSGDPGELIADGRLGGGGFNTINLTSGATIPSVADWDGVQVRATGRAELYEVQIRYADPALKAQGTLGGIDGVNVNRVGIGFDLSAPVLEGPLDRIFFKNTDVAVRSSGVDVTLRDGSLVGLSYGVENLTPGTHCVDATENWWGATNGPSGSLPSLGCEIEKPLGAGSAITDGVLFGDWLGIPSDDGDSIACDDGDGFHDPCTGGATVDCDDNCCIVANESQADRDGDGVGDACDTNPVFLVSSDPADGADFEVVQEAVDATFESGSRIEIFPGLGPYYEPVRLDRHQVYSFTGLDNVTHDPVIIDGGSGPAFHAVNKVGQASMSFSNLTLRGYQGIRSSVNLWAQDTVFEMISQEALQLDAGSHRIKRCEVRPNTPVGIRVADGASLSVSRTTMRGLTDAGLVLAGSAELENVLIAGGNGADGARLEMTGSLDLHYGTIADNTGAGVDNTAGGTVSIERSILYDNGADDLIGVACGALTWSDTGIPDCSSVGDNLSADPLLDLQYRPGFGSPALDHGPPASDYDGTPPTDLPGGPRLLDYDGDGMALNDCGAYEMLDDALSPGEVENLRWELDDFRLVWDVEPSAVEYHIYRDLVSTLSFQDFGTCRDDLDTGRTDTELDDGEDPASGTVFYYLVTAEDGSGDEGTLGYATNTERSNFSACP